jgi:hypothetical protein
VYASYDELPRVGATSIHGDGVRLVWQAQGWSVYVEPPPDRDLLRLLVVLTKVVPVPQRR